MGAIAISEKDMDILLGLQKRLKLKSKAQVVHLALEEFCALVEREHLAKKIRESVRKCAKADLKENRALTGGSSFALDDDT